MPSPQSTLSTPSPNASTALVQIAQLLISQVIHLLESDITTDAQLTHVSLLIPGSTIGKHLRHVHDHYRLLLSSLPPSPSPSPSAGLSPLTLSYDARSRNVVSETSHAAALESFVSLREWLSEVEKREVDAETGVKLQAVTPVRVGLGSTWGRELWFTSLHAIHHFSLLRVIAVGELHLPMPPEFGVAPSTLVYREGGHGVVKEEEMRLKARL